MSLGMLDICSASNLERLSCPKSEGRDVHSSCPSPWRGSTAQDLGCSPSFLAGNLPPLFPCLICSSLKNC